MKRILSTMGLVAALVLALAAPSYSQTTVTSTTLSTAVSSTSANVITVASTTGITAGVGLFVDREAMSVTSVNTTTRQVGVIRGVDGTLGSTHAASATVYVGPTSGITGQGPFWMSDPPIGSCTAANEQYSLRINVQNGRIWSCTGGQWMNVQDGYMWVGPGQCNSSVSGNSTGTNGLTVLGTAGAAVPVVQAQTDGSGTNTHYFTCSIPVPTRTDVVKSVYLVDAEFYYGVQTTALGTQTATLASGTMNSVAVFSKVAYPTPAASETASDATTKTRADSGTLVITPVVGSFNTATTTSGHFYSVKFTPATPFAISTDRTQYFLTVSLLNTATSATVTNSPGFVVHYRTLQAGF